MYNKRPYNRCGDNCEQQKCKKSCKKSTPFFHHLHFAAASAVFFLLFGSAFVNGFRFLRPLGFHLGFLLSAFLWLAFLLNVAGLVRRFRAVLFPSLCRSNRADVCGGGTPLCAPHKSLPRRKRLVTETAKYIASWIVTAAFWTEHTCHLLYLVLLLLYAMNVKEVKPVFYQITSKTKTNSLTAVCEESPSRTVF